ncbi:MAG: acriflavine resistance protein B [Alteromonadaceae bacterium]|nr:MAG: acriflavine resistance protein B [Alteromonadaceae bacterium]
MNITRLAIDNNRLTLVLILVAISMGLQAFLHMPRAYDPGFVIRTAQIVTHFPGASPERVELLISAKIEEVVKQIPELDFVTSESRTGMSIVLVNIKERYTNMRPIWDNVRRKVDDVVKDLPLGAGKPQVNDEFGDVFGIVLAITGEGFSYVELERVAEQVQSHLLRLPDVAKVEIYGEQEERIFIEYDNTRLAEMGLSSSILSQTLQARNIVISGGSFTLGRERISVEPSGNFESVEDIEYTIIQSPGAQELLYLKDIARVKRGYVDPPESLVHASGHESLAIAISMREEGNNSELGQQVQQALQQFYQRYPHGVNFDLINFSPAEVDKKVSDFISSLGQAILIVTLIMLATLGLRTGLVVSALIPVSLLLAVVVMNFLDIGLNQISLAALIIALGMLVDNGIVMSENILVQMQRGKSALEASLQSAAELRMPLLTASLTTAAAFLPIYLAESSVGEFTASLFKVVSITLLCSWLVSLTLIPMLCVSFLKVKVKVKTNIKVKVNDQRIVVSDESIELSFNEEFGSRFYRYYRGLLLLTLNYRKTTLMLTFIVFVVAMSGFSIIPKLFFPPSDRSYFKADLEMPTGTSIRQTQAVVSDIEGYIASELVLSSDRLDGVTDWISYIGDAGPRFILPHRPKAPSANTATMVINVNSLTVIPAMMAALRAYGHDKHPDLDLKLKLIESGPTVNYPVEVRLSGDDSDLLFKAAAKLKQKMRNIGGLVNINDDWGQRIKKLEININQARALRSGVSSQDIALSLQAGLSGFELTEYREGKELIPVILRSKLTGQNDLNQVESLAVSSQSTGRSVPLKQVADAALVWDLSKVFRRNGYRTVTIGAQLAAGVNAAEKVEELKPWLAEKSERWGANLSYKFGGDHESSAVANKSIADKLMVAVLIILLLLVAQFNSLRLAIIVLATIPLGLIGVVVGLIVARSYFGFMTILGIVSLGGIVVNNAIVLLERIGIEREHHRTQLQAIITAAQQRARPILLTTATTVCGLLPLYFGGGEMWESMAVAIIFGLLFSTLLTLVIVPVLYAVFFSVNRQ